MDFVLTYLPSVAFVGLIFSLFVWNHKGWAALFELAMFISMIAVLRTEGLSIFFAVLAVFFGFFFVKFANEYLEEREERVDGKPQA